MEGSSLKTYALQIYGGDSEAHWWPVASHVVVSTLTPDEIKEVFASLPVAREQNHTLEVQEAEGSSSLSFTTLGEAQGCFTLLGWGA